MKAKALLAVPLALASFQGFVANAADDPFSGLPDLTPEDLRALASRLSSIATSGALQDATAGAASSDAEVDVGFVQKALQMLGDLLSSPHSRSLLSDVQSNPEEALRQLLSSQGGEEEEVLQAILMYFGSLRRVLSGNDYLRKQVSELISQNADKLLTEGGFGRVLGEIAASSVFQDLKEEVEEDMQQKAGYAPPTDTGDEMSRRL